MYAIGIVNKNPKLESLNKEIYLLWDFYGTKILKSTATKFLWNVVNDKSKPYSTRAKALKTLSKVLNQRTLTRRQYVKKNVLC